MTVRHLNRVMGSLRITTLREQLYLLSEILERELTVLITGAELNKVFGRKGPWAHGMIAEHLHALDFPDHLHPGRPELVDHTLEVISCDSVFDDPKNDSLSRFLT
jgi:hypothetical protein